MFNDNIQNNTRFALFEFIFVLVSCIALILRPDFSWLFLLVAFLPIVIRVCFKRSEFKSSYINWLIPLFLITSFVGLLVAYDWDPAFHKFLLIVGSILLFFSLSYQTKENLWIIAIILGIFGVTTTIIFVLTNNWSTFPADFQFVEIFGNWWAKIGAKIKFEPYFNAKLFHANNVAGIIAIIIPLSAISSFDFWKTRNKVLTSISLSILIFLCFGLLITSSRAAWIATFLGLVILIALNNLVIKTFITNRKYLFLLIPLMVIAIGIFAPLFLTNYFNSSAISISEVTSFESRLQIARQTYFLISDVPFTGGGLGSFPGLYSQYILSIPYFMFDYSHNLFLDLILEQGVLGFATWMLIIISCSLTLGSTIVKEHKNGDKSFLSSAIFSSLIVFLLHGIMDDAIYSRAWGLPLLFLFPGLSIAMDETKSLNNRKTKYFVMSGAVISSLIIVSFIAFKEQIQANWFANLGAIKMAKTELQDWPTNEWSERVNSPIFDQSEHYFAKSLSHEKENSTANYRQGLIWMARHDFQKALPYLETALQEQPDHRGIQKNTGYIYTWLGKFDQAELVFEQIPEAQYEMEVYEWWWQTQERIDLVENASHMAKQLNNSDN